jgi:hypothetical protein
MGAPMGVPVTLATQETRVSRNGGICMNC